MSQQVDIADPLEIWKFNIEINGKPVSNDEHGM